MFVVRSSCFNLTRLRNEKCGRQINIAEDWIKQHLTERVNVRLVWNAHNMYMLTTYYYFSIIIKYYNCRYFAIMQSSGDCSGCMKLKLFALQHLCVTEYSDIYYKQQNQYDYYIHIVMELYNNFLHCLSQWKSEISKRKQQKGPDYNTHGQFS